MSVQSTLCLGNVSVWPKADLFLAVDWAGSKVVEARRYALAALDKHTDLISSAGILAITTCLFASKIFNSIPKFLPRISLVIFNYGGVIWLNVQVRDLMKSWRDLTYSFQNHQWLDVVETAAKVFYKGVNVLLTCLFFSSSVLGACGVPNAVLAVALAVRPLSLASLAVNIGSDIRDYYANEAVLREITAIEADTDFSCRVGTLMVRFLERIKGDDAVRSHEEICKEKRLADRMICQLDTQTLETFKEKMALKAFEGDPRVEALKLFFTVQDGMKRRQAGVRDNLSLTVMGYLSMGLCKMFPDSLIEMGTRWSMSVLYTDELVRLKFDQMDLESQLS